MLTVTPTLLAVLSSEELPRIVRAHSLVRSVHHDVEVWAA
jgi:hypothetical protein